MRIFKYWTLLEGSVALKHATLQLRCHGGSNDSPEAAHEDARHRLAKVRERIESRVRQGAGYEADILEEPLHFVDTANIITRNRYGAMVLNSTSHVFIDIDEPRYGFFDLFRPRTLAWRKERILAQVAVRAQQADLRRATVRVYETHQGIRLLLQGLRLDPSSPACERLLRSFHADNLYTTLCRKQGCYRARLSPKPHRIQSPTIRLSYPRSDELEMRHQAWLPEYERRCAAHATCRFVRSHGLHTADAIVHLHDELSGAHSGRKLA